MLSQIDNAVASLRIAVGSLDGAALSASDASRVVAVLSEAERVCQAGRAVAAATVVRTRAWRAAGHRTPAAWLAEQAQTPLGQAITAVQTAHRLADLPETRSAFLSGKLSEAQAAAITSAAAADPASESMLLDAAQRETVRELQQRARAVVAAAVPDDDAAERIRRGRYLRHWSDPDGAVRVDGRFAPDEGAGLIAAVDAAAARMQDQAWRSGQREPAQAYAADALVGLVGGTAPAKPVVNLLVDAAAFVRGRTEAGETCRIEGVGPVPVSAAHRLATQGAVKVLATDGKDVTAVAHLGRYIPAHLETAVKRRDPVCVVPGCEVSMHLETDHVLALEDGGVTRISNLARLCRWHHSQKTYHGWRLGGGPGAWTWSRPRARAP